MRAALLLATIVALAGCASSSQDSMGSMSKMAANEIVAKAASGAMGDHFEPDHVTIAAHSEVKFTVESGHHTVDFDEAVEGGHSGDLAPGQSFSVTLHNGGTYHFHCNYHVPGMVGTVTVT